MARNKIFLGYREAIFQLTSRQSPPQLLAAQQNVNDLCDDDGKYYCAEWTSR